MIKIPEKNLKALKNFANGFCVINNCSDSEKDKVKTLVDKAAVLKIMRVYHRRDSYICPLTCKEIINRYFDIEAYLEIEKL